MNITIGVIIPAYNVEAYIEECVTSVLNQSVPFDEIIIVNDGSDDRTGEIIEKIIEKKENVTYIDQNNAGQGAARNKALRAVKSDYVMFLDSDDYLNLNMIENLKSKIKNQDVLAFSAKIIDEIGFAKDKNKYYRSIESCGIYSSGWKFIGNNNIKKIIVSPCMMVYRRDLLRRKEITFPEKTVYEDELFFLKVINYSGEFEVIPDVYYCRRYRSGSVMTSSNNEQYMQDSLKIYGDICEFLYNECEYDSFGDSIKKYIFWKISNLLYRFSDNQINRLFNQYRVALNLFHDVVMKKFDIINLSCSELVILMKVEHVLGIKSSVVNKSICAKLIILYSSVSFCDCKKTIAIYGKGKYAEAILNIYSKLCGPISCCIKYIVSEKKCTDDNEIEVCNIPPSIDNIIIGSKKYAAEMLNMLEINGYCKEKIIVLKDNDEIVDMVSVYNALDVH